MAQDSASSGLPTGLVVLLVALVLAAAAGGATAVMLLRRRRYDRRYGPVPAPGARTTTSRPGNPAEQRR